MTSFSDLGLAETLLRALEREGYHSPTPIQADAIPTLLQGRDLIGIAQTGTGKTAAFALPLITRLIADRRRPAPGSARILVLAPTRELAQQIGDSFRAYAHNLRPALSLGVIVGGVGHRPQIDMLARGLEVLVATPGRLIEHIEAGRAKLGATQALVLDEADHMLDLGFILPIRRIVAHLPKRRQTLMFSATMPKEIAQLAADLLNDPVRVSVTPVATTADRIDQQVVFVESAGKRDVLVELMRDDKVKRAIVFTRTKRGADRVAEHLETAGVGAAAIHGNKSQNQRIRALDGFKRGDTRVLVATDIAARGIDIDGVTHVVNYELPDVPEAYVHRIGRTARAGKEGRAISLCANDERALLKQIEKLTRQTLPSTDKRSAEGRLQSETPAPKARATRRPNRDGGRPAAKPQGEAAARRRAAAPPLRAAQANRARKPY